MGNSTEKEKFPLMEFFYKDIELIESFYSQMFGGDLRSVQKIITESEEVATALDAGIPSFFKGNNSSKNSSK